jgi:hypothetical protein
VLARFLITTLAEYQSEFWRDVGLEMQRRGHRVAFLSFDDRSTDLLAAAGLTVFPRTREHDGMENEADAEQTIHAAGLTDTSHWLRHERHAFGLSEERTMKLKLARVIRAADHALSAFSQNGRVTLVQELGGFLSVVGSFFSARRKGLDCWFIEPSFFRGRLLFIPNRFEAFQLPAGRPSTPTPELLTYLTETRQAGAIVIPEKDRHQYRDAWSKVVNYKNVRRLFEKARDKYIFGKRQEFGYIGHHVRQHAAMIVNSWRQRRSYTPLDQLGRFAYYPFHVPGDMALTLRSPKYLNQIELVERLCATLPDDVALAVKEHPAMIGAIGSKSLLALKRRIPNFVILPPATNNYEVLARAAAVVTVNSKSGAEAGMLGKPVVVLGDAFYRHAPFAHPAEDVDDAGRLLRAVLNDEVDAAPPGATAAFFAALWPHTFPGELYVATPENVSRFCSSMIDATSQAPLDGTNEPRPPRSIKR